jgi:6-pyruvoyltetrahydropterin/6-carboxytetrahydropterin synthase
MKFEITTRRVFSAAHQLKLYDGSLEPLHGHNWVVRVTVGAEKLDAIGVVMDFHELDRQVEGILAGWHNRHLNEVAEFGVLNPSTENVAVVVAEKLKLPAGVKVVRVEVWETEGNSAVYRP